MERVARCGGGKGLAAVNVQYAARVAEGVYTVSQAGSACGRYASCNVRWREAVRGMRRVVAVGWGCAEQAVVRAGSRPCQASGG